MIITQVSVVVPLYNEDEVLEETYRRLTETMQSAADSYELIFVNDGSRDGTWVKALSLTKRDPHVKLINFSRNFGHQTAITAGMDRASGAAVVVIDADLQDPPAVITAMLDKWKEGYEVVYGKRLKRKGETIFKLLSAKLFYRVLRSLTDVELPVDAGDFRLLDRKVVEALKTLPERNRYVRGLVSWVGFKQTAVEYVREERFAGKTKYPLRKMLRFAKDGLASFSYKPLKLPIAIGSVLSLVSFFFLIFLLCQKWMSGVETGLSMLVTLCLFFQGLGFVTMGIVGEYIGRIYDETKGRPLYIVADMHGFEDS